MKDSDSSILPHASMGRTSRQSHHVNYALLSYISDVHEPDTAEEALSHPLWREVLVAEMSSIDEDDRTREDFLMDISTLEDTLVVPPYISYIDFFKFLECYCFSTSSRF